MRDTALRGRFSSLTPSSWNQVERVIGLTQEGARAVALPSSQNEARAAGLTGHAPIDDVALSSGLGIAESVRFAPGCAWLSHGQTNCPSSSRCVVRSALDAGTRQPNAGASTSRATSRPNRCRTARNAPHASSTTRQHLPACRTCVTRPCAPSGAQASIDAPAASAARLTSTVWPPGSSAQSTGTGASAKTAATIGSAESSRTSSSKYARSTAHSRALQAPAMAASFTPGRTAGEPSNHPDSRTVSAPTDTRSTRRR
jgi:hypothetical protein